MPVVDQKRRELLRFLAEHGDLFASQGSVQEAYRLYKGRKLGPFFRLSFREAGKQRSLYIGRDRALAGAIERQLQTLQASRARARQLERCLADCRRSLQAAKLEFRCRLEAQGLHLQGNEIRGWRTHRHRASAPTMLPVPTPRHVARAPSTHPAQRSAVTGSERRTFRPSLVWRQLSCLDKPTCRLPQFAARQGCQNCSTPWECQPDQEHAAPRGPWAQEDALSKRITDHALF
jgi:hypothetical protein